jgi:uncharacterized protein YrrD
MDLRAGTPVYGRKGYKIGEISHVILDGQNDAMTHLVVSKGWLLPRDIVVAKDDIEVAASDMVQLRLSEDELDAQPDFIEAHYVRSEEGQPLPAGYGTNSVLYGPMVPPLGVGWNLPYRYMYAPPPESVTTEVNVPEGSVSLIEGMDVWVGDQKAGTLAGVRFHPRQNYVTHLLVSKGWLFPEEQIVPTSAIASVDERGILLVAPPRQP